LSGGVLGGVVGGVVSALGGRRKGESQEDFRSRVRRSTVAGGVFGAMTGASIGGETAQSSVARARRAEYIASERARAGKRAEEASRRAREEASRRAREEAEREARRQSYSGYGSSGSSSGSGYRSSGGSSGSGYGSSGSGYGSSGGSSGSGYGSSGSGYGSSGGSSGQQRPKGGYEGYQERKKSKGSTTRDPLNQAINSKVSDERARSRLEALARGAKKAGTGPESESYRRNLEREAKKYGLNADDLMKHASFSAGVETGIRSLRQ
jgi:hypothetical protein